ncbi:MAG: phenylalanine--tRNA ligase subunit alpha [Spirochaetaceae bacterium]|nr:phenylalanine--tRNA ligase subunit alpha [Spirochaetaceae bacterium]|tara:strand:+ start:12097 stop:13134 length:1038 start_codon:yes stop_codon:yes gene_type:complete
MSLLDRLQALNDKAVSGLENCEAPAELESLYHEILGKKGELTEILKGIKDLSPEEKKHAGSRANEIRSDLEKRFKDAQSDLKTRAMEKALEEESFDVLRPVSYHAGGLHPISEVQYQVEEIFSSMGFRIMDGPEVETDESNFGSLNFSDDHPARDMQDTIWVEGGNLLRTHTSTVQVRSMKMLEPPFRIVAPGRVFRFEQTDASHETTFHQVEGMMVDKEVSVSHLIYVMKTFLRRYFEKDVEVRLRPGYFPFVEPGFELDFSCLVCDGKGCSVCKHSGWVEIMPCGLVHPNVLSAGGIDPSKWQGFAFGLGLSRLVMMRHKIEDIRHLLSGNMRFFKAFHGQAH